MKIPVYIKKLVWVLLLALSYLLPVLATMPVTTGGPGHTVSVAAAGDGLFEPHWDKGWPEQRAPDEAARIRQRYHQQLQALLSAVPDFPADRLAPPRKAEVKISSAVYNSTCLSSCYDYIFRLCPF